MSASLVQFGSTMMCPHGAAVLQTPSQSVLLADNQPILLPQDATTIIGCPLNVSGSPHPCVTVQWSGLATQSKIQQTAPLLASSVGLCQSADGTVQGTVIMSGIQTKVSGR